MKPLLPTILICLTHLTAFAQDATTQANPQYSKEEKAEIATALGVVYVGMPKADLYKVFSKLQQKDSYKEGNEEWLTFSDWMTEETGDLIIFYLGDGKVKGWKVTESTFPMGVSKY